MPVQKEILKNYVVIEYIFFFREITLDGGILQWFFVKYLFCLKVFVSLN